MARLAHYLMASEWRAALIASIAAALPLLSWAGASVVALYALRRGLDQSLMVIALWMFSALVMALGSVTQPCCWYCDYSCLGSSASPDTKLAHRPRRGAGHIAWLRFLVGALYEETLET